MKRILFGVVFLVSLPGDVFTQTAGTQLGAVTSASALPAFQVADVHVSPHHNDPELDGGLLYGDRYIVHQATMVDLITAAYGLKPENVQGGPPWLERDRFDIIAKAQPTTPPATLKLMLRALLAERFHLVLHEGSAPIPVYALSVGNAKPNLKESDGTKDTGCHDAAPASAPTSGVVSNNHIACVNMTMEQFVEILQNIGRGYFDVPVVDLTGLKGAYDFNLTWIPRRQLARAAADGISILNAVDKQLGLKLVLQTASLPVVLVDNVDRKPTPNSPDLAKLLPAPPPAEFEVAVIKPSRPGSTDANASLDRGGKVDLQNITLRQIINFGWDFDDDETDRIANAPKWLDKDRFDIVAKVSQESLASNASNAPIPIEDLLQMLRTLLIERFQMKVHLEDRPVDAYVLVATNPKLRKAADPTARTRCKQGPGPDGKDPRITNPVLNRLVSCQNMTMAELGDEFQHIAGGYIHTPVFDETNLQGGYDLTLSFSGANQALPGANHVAQQGETSEPNGALRVFDAVNKQLGLKLEKRKRSLPVLVIDHIEEKPTEN